MINNSNILIFTFSVDPKILQIPVSSSKFPHIFAIKITKKYFMRYTISFLSKLNGLKQITYKTLNLVGLVQ